MHGNDHKHHRNPAATDDARAAAQGARPASAERCSRAPRSPSPPRRRAAVADPAAAPAAPAAAEDFQQVTLAKGEPEVGEPMSLAVLPDRSVLHTSRDGELRLTDSAGNTRLAGKLAVYSHDEEGLQGVGVDPGFADNRFIYLYYAPPLDTPAGDAPETGTAADFAPFDGVNRLSRFVLNADGTLDNASEKKILDVPATRAASAATSAGTSTSTRPATSTCRPVTTPTRSSRTATRPSTSAPTATPSSTPSAPPATPTTCAARSCAIKVNADGSYAVPDGNLFAPGTDKTQPRDLRDGLPQPVPLQRRQEDRHPLRRRLRPGRRCRRSRARPRPARSSSPASPSPATSAGPTARATTTPTWTTTSRTGASGASFDCAAPEEHLAQQHRSDGPAPGPVRLDPLRRWIRTRVRHRLRVPDGRPGLRLRRLARLARSSSPRRTTGTSSPGSSAAAGSSGSTSDDSGTVQSINDVPWTGTQVMDMAFGPDGALYVLDYGTRLVRRRRELRPVPDRERDRRPLAGGQAAADRRRDRRS